MEERAEKKEDTAGTTLMKSNNPRLAGGELIAIQPMEFLKHEHELNYFN